MQKSYNNAKKKGTKLLMILWLVFSISLIQGCETLGKIWNPPQQQIVVSIPQTPVLASAYKNSIGELCMNPQDTYLLFSYILSLEELVEDLVNHRGM